ncbi:hypothetical protein [Sphingomonas sp. DT-51]|uniref:hypothetical protein n=1 Tax=Sphingomonas sp. DT-51 TaxID=3396165 RepID=UPI003F5414E4
MIERRAGGGVLIGPAMLLAVIVGAYPLLVGNNSDVARNDAITSATKSVGDTADKAGAAADRLRSKRVGKF